MSAKLTHVLFVGNANDKELLEFGDLSRYIQDHCKALHPEWVYIGKYLSDLKEVLAYVENQKAVTTVVINHVRGHSKDQMKEFAVELCHELRRQSPIPSVYLIDTGASSAYLRPIFQKFRIPVAVNTENNLIDIILEFEAVFGDRSVECANDESKIREESRQAQNGKLQEQLAFMDF